MNCLCRLWGSHFKEVVGLSRGQDVQVENATVLSQRWQERGKQQLNIWQDIKEKKFKHLSSPKMECGCFAFLRKGRQVFLLDFVFKLISQVARRRCEIYKWGTLATMPRSSEVPGRPQLQMENWSTGWFNLRQKGVSKNRGTPKWMVYNGKPY